MLEVRNLCKSFRDSGKAVHAVNGVSFSLEAGTALGLVGESGSGKSTLARLVLRLLEPDAGSIRFNGTNLLDLDFHGMRAQRRWLQIVFQDPFSALNPRMPVHQLLSEPLLNFGLIQSGEARAKASELLALVGLDDSGLFRFPHEFSGGQRQRLCIARALSLQPRLLVLDEPTSGLDVSVQAQLLSLLQRLQKQFGLSYLFISHDLRVVKAVCGQALVLKDGRVVEAGSTRQLFSRPSQAYTRQLVEASKALSLAKF